MLSTDQGPTLKGKSNIIFSGTDSPVRSCLGVTYHQRAPRTPQLLVWISSPLLLYSQDFYLGATLTPVSDTFKRVKRYWLQPESKNPIGSETLWDKKMASELQTPLFIQNQISSKKPRECNTHRSLSKEKCELCEDTVCTAWAQMWGWEERVWKAALLTKHEEAAVGLSSCPHILISHREAVM